MEMSAYIEEVKDKVSCFGTLSIENELNDAQITRIIQASLREVQRYIHDVEYISVPFKSCIDTSQMKISEVKHIYAGDVATSPVNGGATGTAGDAVGDVSIYANTPTDPFYLQSSLYGGIGTGNITRWSNFISNYYAYAMTRKAVNSGDLHKLAFVYEKEAEKLYINSGATCNIITIEYTRRFDNVNQITNDGWIDILMRFAVANAKYALGLARTRVVQSNPLYTQDGETMRNEGLAELTELRTFLDGSITKLRMQ